MRVFGAGCAELSVSEVAAAAEVTRATARRILLTLAAIGYVTESDGRFALSPRVLDLGFSYLGSLELSDLIEPAMAELATRVDFPCSASVRDGDELVIVHIVQGPTHRLLRFNAHIGTRLPAYPGAMGRILLAGLKSGELDDYLERVALAPFTQFTVRTKSELREAVERARRDGWCLVDRERDLGVISLAVPLVGRFGKVIAALNLSVHAGTLSADDVRGQLLPELLRTQQKINEGLRIRS